MKKLFLAIVLLFIIFAPAWAESEGEDVQKHQEELENIQKKLEKSKEKLRETKEEERAVLNRLYDLTRQERTKQKELGVAKEKISRNEHKISKLVTQLKVAEEDLEDKQNALRRRIVEMYKAGGLPTIQLILSASSITDFFNRSLYFQRIIEQDLQLIGEVSRRFREVNTAKVELEGATDEVRQLSRLIAAKRREIGEQAEQKKEIYKLVKEKREQYETRVAQLEKSSLELEHLIQNLTQKGGQRLGQSTGNFIWPLNGRLTSRFGYRRHPLWGGTRFHNGLDIAAPFGTRIVAADGGEVILAKWWDGYGKAVVVQHTHNRSTVYGHMSRLYVKQGDEVQQGQLIGLVGSTGYSTGPHLHFEIRYRGKPINPLPHLP